MLRMNSGLNLKLSAENTPPARSFNAARCLSGETGVSGQVRRAGVIADVVDAADVFRRERGGAPDLAEPGLEAAAQDIIDSPGLSCRDSRRCHSSCEMSRRFFR